MIEEEYENIEGIVANEASELYDTFTCKTCMGFIPDKTLKPHFDGKCYTMFAENSWFKLHTLFMNEGLFVYTKDDCYCTEYVQYD